MIRNLQTKEYTCDKCGKVATMPYISTPPIGWMRVSVDISCGIDPKCNRVGIYCCLACAQKAIGGD